MSERLQELARIDVTDQPTQDVTCPECGRSYTLFFNGGELDRKECHGYVWETVHAKIELVTSRES